MILMTEKEFIEYPVGTVFNVYQRGLTFVNGVETVVIKDIHSLVVKVGDKKVPKGEAPCFVCRDFNDLTGEKEYHLQRRYHSDNWSFGVLELADIQQAIKSLQALATNEVYAKQKKCLTPETWFDFNVSTDKKIIDIKTYMPESFTFPVTEQEVKALEDKLHDALELVLIDYFK